MPVYKLILEYDGTNFSGWQIQNDVRTVQGDVEQALTVLLRERTRVTAAGRTDSGVHALAQVAHFCTSRQIDCERLQRSLNGTTRSDIFVKALLPAEDGFHARFSATARQYLYRIATAPIAVGRAYVYYCKFPLDFDALQRVAAAVVGEHNFRAFSARVPGEKHYLCRVVDAEWRAEPKKGLILFRIKANRFLHGMVRRIVGTAIDVGRGRLPLEEMKRALTEMDPHVTVKAPAHGLFLEKVYYENE